MRKLFFAFVVVVFTLVLGFYGKSPSAEVKLPKVKHKSVFKLPSLYKQYLLFKRSSVKDGRYVYFDGNYTYYFTINPRVQDKAQKDFKAEKVKYGAFVALDAHMGKVICAVSSLDYPNLLFKNTFRAASTFKVVTSAAAIESGIAGPNTEMVYGGHDDSCSPYVWLKSPYKMRRTMKEAFAYSSNPFFGNLGRILGANRLMEFAEKFGFNRKGRFWGFVRKPLGDYDLALEASGLGEVRSSPIHEALISATVENNGIMPKPNLIEKVVDKSGKTIYSFKPRYFGRVISTSTALKLKQLMKATVRFGTVSNKRFFRLFRSKHPFTLLAGKTGTLSELTYPEGRCEWFTGFLENTGNRIAFSSLAVNGGRYYITGYGMAPLILNSALKEEPCAYSVR